MRISRMDSLGGSWPPLKPSMKMAPPLGPADGPARAWRSAVRSSGASGSASRAAPLMMVALALLEVSTLTDGPGLSLTVSCWLAVATLSWRFRVLAPARRVMEVGWGVASWGAVAVTLYAPGLRLGIE